MAGTVESPLRREAHGGFGERPGETGQRQRWNRAPGRLSEELAAAGIVPHLAVGSARNRELELLHPRLIVTVGGLALRRMLGLTELTPCVGERFDRSGVPVVPLPHPSGASSWPHLPANRARLDRALELVRTELGRL